MDELWRKCEEALADAPRWERVSSRCGHAAALAVLGRLDRGVAEIQAALNEWGELKAAGNTTASVTQTAEDLEAGLQPAPVGSQLLK